MKKLIYPLFILVAIGLSLMLTATVNGPAAMKVGTPAIKSISALEFSPEGILFIGDSRSAEILAIDLGDGEAYTGEKRPVLKDFDVKAASMAGHYARSHHDP